MCAEVSLYIRIDFRKAVCALKSVYTSELTSENSMCAEVSLYIRIDFRKAVCTLKSVYTSKLTSEKQYVRWSQSIHQNWLPKSSMCAEVSLYIRINFRKAVCALKSVYASELKADLSKQIDVYSKNNCLGHGSGQLFPANRGVVSWHRPSVFNVFLKSVDTFS